MTNVTINNTDDDIFEGTENLLASIESTDPVIMISENSTFLLTIVDDEGTSFGLKAHCAATRGQGHCLLGML